MCYSAVIEQDFRRWEQEFGAEPSDRWQAAMTAAPGEDTRKVKIAGKDGRIFPFYLAPVLTLQQGQARIEPMIYSAFPPPGVDSKAYTTFNARRDNLRSPFWASAFGVHHGLILLRGFYEWVGVRDLLKAGVVRMDDVVAVFQRQAAERRERLLAAGKKWAPTATEKKDPRLRQIMIHFQPKDHEILFVPAIFNEREGQLGFAIVTDDPSDEIRAAGHDRAPITLTHAAAGAWLHPEGKTVAQLMAILAQRPSEHYQHFLDQAA